MTKKPDKILILGDLHNRWQKTAEVLRQAGVMDDEGNRVDGWHVIQLGDALSLGYDEQEAEFFEWLQDWVDEWLVGNHELASLWFNDRHIHLGWDADNWHGWKVGRDREAESMARSKMIKGEYKAATNVGKWLITHAGVLPKYLRRYNWKHKDASVIAEEINEKFFTAMEKRVGTDFLQGMDGMFWVRIWDLQNGYDKGKGNVPQIVGHTPDRKWCPDEIHKDLLWCIDSPPVHHHIHGGVVGLVTEDEGETFTMCYAP